LAKEEAMFKVLVGVVLAGLGSLAAAPPAAVTAPAQTQAAILDPARHDLPNPNPTVVAGWGRLPEGRRWGSTAGVDIGPDGHVWAIDRCGANECTGSSLDPILKFDRQRGGPITSFGGGMLVFPHGLHVDREGNVWVTDARGNEQGTMGHQVVKFAPDGRVLLRLGRAGLAGSGRDTLNEPTDVITAPSGDVFVADGHSGQNADRPPDATGRIVKFTRDGRYVKEWGRLGSGPGEFRTPHALAFDSRGRLFVADRGNHRIQIFDQEGRLLDTWLQFGRVSGLFIDASDTLFAIDSESNRTRHPDWKTGIRIGTTAADKVVAFIPPHKTNDFYGAAGEGVAVDRDGHVYAAEGPSSRPVAGGGLTKYLRR
jgi:DNA-binding beta-propeller fold protein YncE